MTPEFRSAFVADLITTLSTPTRSWSEVDGRLLSSGTMAIEFDDPKDSPSHVDVAIFLNRHRPDAPVLRDCISGFGDTPKQAAATAATLFHHTSWATVEEWLAQNGEFATHFRGQDAGARGWHVIVSPVVWYGVNTHSGEALQQWLLERPPLGGISGHVAAELSPRQVHGVKLLVGGFGENRTAEIRIDGVASEAASARLRDLDWQSPDEFALARTYALFIPDEPPPS